MLELGLKDLMSLNCFGTDEIFKLGLRAYLVCWLHGECLFSDSFLFELTKGSVFLRRFKRTELGGCFARTCVGVLYY